MGESKKLILSLGLSSPRPWGRREWGDSPFPHGEGWGRGGVRKQAKGGIGIPRIRLSPHKSPSLKPGGVLWGDLSGEHWSVQAQGVQKEFK